jgi:hypothetical protein
VPRLADKGLYLASESSFYRVLKKHQQLNHRERTGSIQRKSSSVILNKRARP